MGVLNLKKDKVRTGIILAVSLTGIFYFGYRAVRDKPKYDQENPFAYDVKKYEQSGSDLVLYSELKAISIPLP